MSVLPWHRRQWAQLERMVSGGRLPHALLLSAARGSGADDFARSLAGALLCTAGDGGLQACGECKSCRLWQAGTHPDLLWVQPEEAGKQIRIDAVRELIRYAGLTSQYGRFKIALLEPAEAMNRNAANSLLKTLEEPPAQSLIVLVSYQPSSLPVTVRSRCQRLDLPVAATVDVIAWLADRIGSEHDAAALLAASGNAPLAAVEMLENGRHAHRQALLDELRALSVGKADPVKTAEQWTRYGARDVLVWLTTFVEDMIRLKSLDNPPRLAGADARAALQALAERLDLAGLFGIHERLAEQYRLVTGPYNVREQELLEDFTIGWSDELMAHHGR